jgi:hypothetical protein
MTAAPPEEARASVVLLEGKAIDIRLTMQGYTVIFSPCRIAETSVDNGFRLLIT